MKRFTYDFSGFVLGAALCSVPICMVIDSIFSPLFATERAVHNGSGDWEGVVTLPSGAPNALSLPGNPVLHTGESHGQAGVGLTLGKDRGSARSSSATTFRSLGETMASAQRELSEGRPVLSGRADQKREGPHSGPLVHAIASTRGASGGASLRVSGLYEITAYSHHCVLPASGKEGPAQRAANGRWPVADRTVAADPSIPFGAELLIEGLGFRTVGDRGSAIKGRRLDLFVDSCREAREFGRRWLRVYPVPPETTREARQ